MLGCRKPKLSSFIHSFIHQVSLEYLLCAWHPAGALGSAPEHKTDKVPAPQSLQPCGETYNKHTNERVRRIISESVKSPKEIKQDDVVERLGRGSFLGGLWKLSDSRMRSVGEKGVSATGMMNMRTVASRSDPKAWWLSRGTRATGQDEAQKWLEMAVGSHTNLWLR